MLKEVVASKAAKLIAACVCPVAGTAALTVSVPEVRQAVHRATAPRAHAKPKVKERATPARAAAAITCPQPQDTPVLLGDSSIAPMFAGVTLLPPVPLEAPAAQPGTNLALLPRRFVPGGPFAFPGPPAGIVPPPGPAIPEPEVWLQLVLGFTVIGGATRVTYRQQRRVAAAENGEA